MLLKNQMKYTLALVGIVSSAVSPLPSSANWPIRTGATLITAADATQEDATDFITETYSKVSGNPVGPYRAFRNGFVVFPTQKIIAATNTNGNKGSVETQGTATRTFWVSANTMYGAYPTVATTSSGFAVGAMWTVCKFANLTDITKCNGGPSRNTGENKNYLIPHRIAFQVNNVSAITIGDQSESYPATTWNQDILLASLYQSSYTGATAVVDGTKWCSEWKNTVKSDATDQATLAAQKGLTGRNKCTWLVLTSDGNAAPGIRLTNADYVLFTFQWIEWITVAALGTNGVLPATEASPTFIGAYDAATGVFLNPVKTTST